MVILFGPAGSGKSVQGQRLAEKFGWKWLSIGQLLREQNDEKLNEIMRVGALVDDNLVVDLMHGRMVELASKGQGAILDGYPRNEWQAQWIIEHGDTEMLDGAIILRVPHNELWARLQARGRADDLSREAIETRWGIFESEEARITEVLRQHGVKIEDVDGVGEIDEITDRLIKVIEGWQ